MMLQPAFAEPLPGADDPKLREAALAWLAEDEPNAALWAIGELATDRNVAARVFLNQIYRSEMSSLSREFFMRFLPEDSIGVQFSGYRFDDDAHPALRALNQIADSESADKWIAHAEAIVAAGMQSRLAPYVEYALLYQHDINIEVAEFSAEHLRDDPYISNTVVWFFAFSHLTASQWTEMQSVEVAEQWQSRWTGAPWSQAREYAFTQELLAHSWEALRTEGMLRDRYNGPEQTARLVDTTLLDDEIFRLADLLNVGSFINPELGELNPPTEAELQRLGQIYRQYATRLPSEIPTVTLCERHCPSRVAACIGSAGLMMGDIGLAAYPNYVPVLTVKEYYHSERAVRARRDLLSNMDLQQKGYPEWMVLPQCMANALHLQSE
jgi:hypothetical protein